MRTIKFRGKRIDNGEWIYGYYVFRPDGKHLIYWKPFDGASQNTYHEVIHETVGQFTGLLDKNGKEIYEGDECECTYETIPNRVGVVKYNVENWEFSIEDDEPDDLRSYWLTVEIIGNIH